MFDHIPLEGFVLQQEDVQDLWKDITQEQAEAVATVLTDYLMEHWYDHLREAVTAVREAYYD